MLIPFQWKSKYQNTTPSATTDNQPIKHCLSLVSDMNRFQFIGVLKGNEIMYQELTEKWQWEENQAIKRSNS